MSVEVATEILRVEGPGGWCVIERAAVCQALSARAKSFGSLQRVLVDKAEDEGDELLGPLHPQHVTRAWSGQQLIARARDPLGDCSTCRRWGEDILLARDHERVRTDRTQPIQGVVFFLGLPLLAGRADLRLGLRASQPSSQTCRLRPDSKQDLCRRFLRVEASATRPNRKAQPGPTDRGTALAAV